jgi:hypothetical protein
VQSEGKSLQLGEGQVEAGSARQGVSLFVQFCLSISCVGALLCVANDTPFHLQMVAGLMAFPK